MTEEQWESANSGESKIVRWEEQDKPEVMAKTIFVGKVIQGIYLGPKEGVGKKKGTLHTVKTTEHGDLAIWESTVLKDAFSKIPVGSEVRIESLGLQTSKKGDTEYRNFDVKFRGAPMQSATQPMDIEM